MATTRLTDLALPTSFSDYTVQLTAQKSRLVQSGVAQLNQDAINALAMGPGVFTMRRYADVDGGDDVIPTDNPANVLQDSDIEAFGTFTMRAVTHPRVKAWSEMDLAVELNGSDPRGALANRFATAWARTWQRIGIASLQGCIAAGEAASAGAYSFTSTASDAELTSAAVIKAWDLIGDSSTNLVAMAMHSKIYHRLQQLNLIDFIPDSRGEIVLATYLGLEVIVDDGLPVNTTPDPDQYSTYLLGEGALQVAIGTGVGLMPESVDRDEKSGNGGGQTNVYSRRRIVAHPFGFEYDGSTDGDTPTTTELQDADNWGVTAPERKQIPIVELIAAATLTG
jgi:hypothetical protein